MSIKERARGTYKKKLSLEGYLFYCVIRELKSVQMLKFGTLELLVMSVIVILLVFGGPPGKRLGLRRLTVKGTSDIIAIGIVFAFLATLLFLSHR